MKHMMIGIVTLLFCISFISLPAAALFNEITIREDTNGACALAAADFNEDGHVDFVYTCYPGHHIQWMENNGDQSFTPHMVIENFTNAKAIDVGDINGDGHIDFVATADYGNLIIWFQNDGTGDFTDHELSSAWVRPAYVQATDHFLDEPIDINGDGHNDIVAVSCQSDRVGWFENNDDGTFTEHIVKDQWAHVSCVSAVDVDGDDDTDLLVAAHESGFVWLENTGEDENFPVHTLFTEWDHPNWIAAGDIDGDGDVDFAGTSCGTSRAVGWFENDGDESFTPHVLASNYAGARCPVINDIDEDGDVDIFSIAWQASRCTFFENTSDEVFARRTLNANAYDMLKLFVVDLDSDGDRDLLASTAVAGSNHLRWFEAVDHFLQPEIEVSAISGHAPLMVQFADVSYARPDVASWAWDLDADGAVDDDECNVEHIYETPGEYAASVTLDNGVDTVTHTLDPPIRVFDGDSCIEFNGVNSLCNAAAQSELALTGDFTFEACIRPEGPGESGDQGGRIFDKSVVSLHTCSSSVPGHVGLVARMALTGNTGFAAWGPSDALVVGEWAHVAFTFEAASCELKLYVNGAELPLEWIDPPSGAIINNAAFGWIVGNASSGNHTFDGCIDEVRLWNVCRSQDAIQATMQQYLQGDETGLTACWRMNEGAGDMLFDITANALDMSIANAAWAQGAHFNFNDAGDEAVPPPAYALGNRPNPFNPETVWRFSLPKAEQTSLAIFNVRGQQVRRIDAGVLPAGEHEIVWDGKDDNGETVSSGVYMCALRCGAVVRASRKCLMLK